MPISTDTINMSGLPPQTKASSSRWKWLVYAGIIMTVLALARYFNAQELLRRALDWVAQLGPWGAVLFTLIYIAAAVLLIPGSVLTMGAGAMFGLVGGTLVVSLASTAAATVAFLVGRHLAREAVRRRIEGNARFDAIDRAVAAEGWKIVLLTRLSPVFPYTLLNYAFGLTQVKLSHYVLASWIGMLPGTVMYVYFGTLARAGAEGRTRTLGEWVLYGVGLLATIGVTIFITRLARRALARKIEA